MSSIHNTAADELGLQSISRADLKFANSSPSRSSSPDNQLWHEIIGSYFQEASIPADAEATESKKRLSEPTDISPAVEHGHTLSPASRHDLSINTEEPLSEPSYAFRLFSTPVPRPNRPSSTVTTAPSTSSHPALPATAFPRIILSSASQAPTGSGAFLPPHRPLQHYLTSALPESVRAQRTIRFRTCALSGADVHALARGLKYRGCEYPWRVSRSVYPKEALKAVGKPASFATLRERDVAGAVVGEEKKDMDGGRERDESKMEIEAEKENELPVVARVDASMTTVVSESDAHAGRRKKKLKPNKKRRIAIRVKKGKIEDEERRKREEKESREREERERRTKKNRDRKVKRRERERKKKGTDVEGESEVKEGEGEEEMLMEIDEGGGEK